MKHPHASAAKFAEEARAHGFEADVAVRGDQVEVEVVKVGDKDFRSYGVAIWAEVNVATANSRLGFKTEYKPGLRFQYAVSKVGETYREHSSLRSLKGTLGLPVGEHR